MPFKAPCSRRKQRIQASSPKAAFISMGEKGVNGLQGEGGGRELDSGTNEETEMGDPRRRKRKKKKDSATF